MRSKAQEGFLVGLGELEPVYPRGFIVYVADIAYDDTEALRRLREAPDLVTSQVVLLADENPVELPSPQFSASANHVKLVSYNLSEVIYDLQTEQPGYFFASEAYYPGWNAYLDSAQAKVYRANFAFRAVYIPAGEHRLVFRYKPFSVVLGAWIAAISALIIATNELYSHNPRVFRRPPSAPLSSPESH